MFTYLFALLTPPIFKDAESMSAARQLYYILLWVVPTAAIFLLFKSPSRYLGISWNHYISGSMVIIAIILLWLLRRGLACHHNQCHLWWPARSRHADTPVLLIFCSVMLSSRATTIVGVVIGLIASFLFLNERAGVDRPHPRVVDINYFLVAMVSIGLTVMVLYFTVNHIVQSAQQIHQQALELQDKNRQLEQIQSMLEIRSNELSNLNAELQFEMSERMRAETILRQNQKLESIGRLAGGVAHDFNNLLTSILGQSSLALRNLRPDHKAHRHLEKSITSVQRAADLTRQLLAYAEKSTFQIEPIDLNQLLQENHDLLETMIQQNSTLRFDLQSWLPAIESDRGQLQQVIMNLVLNAAEAIDHDHGVITVTTQTVVLNQPVHLLNFIGQPPEPYISLTVQDNGTGMTSATIERIFDPYFSTKARGHGLGLLHPSLITQNQVVND